jgi:hypothetical protein
MISRQLDDQNGEGAAPIEPPGPFVVVQYRRSLASRVAVPVLVVIAAGAVLSHRVRLDDWQGITSLRSKPETVVAETPPRPIVSPLLSAPNLIRWERETGKRSQPGPLPRPLARLPITSPAFLPILPFPEQGARTAEAWETLRREAEEAKIEAASMRDLKAHAIPAVRGRGLGEEDRLPLEERAEIELSRQEFHDGLRRALAQSSTKIARAIEELCDAQGISLAPDRLALGTAPAPALTTGGRRSRVEKLRAKGMTEPAILSYLVRIEARNRAARSGPKSHDETLVRAARQLLAVPPPRPI